MFLIELTANLFNKNCLLLAYRSDKRLKFTQVKSTNLLNNNTRKNY